jgi:hypothetical protein
MRTAIVAVLFGISAIGLLSCEEAKKLSYVEGVFESTPQGEDFAPKGSLAHGGAKYYGYCKYTASSNKFEFEVGDATMNDIDSVTETYVKFSGIVGPPVAGVYSDLVAKIPKEGVDFHTVFTNAIIANGGNQFSFDQPDDTEQCYVALFATAAEGEVTKTDDAEFDYYIQLNCPSLDDVSSGSTNLNGFNGWFFFQGC